MYGSRARRFGIRLLASGILLGATLAVPGVAAYAQPAPCTAPVGTRANTSLDALLQYLIGKPDPACAGAAAGSAGNYVSPSASAAASAATAAASRAFASSAVASRGALVNGSCRAPVTQLDRLYLSLFGASPATCTAQ